MLLKELLKVGKGRFRKKWKGCSRKCRKKITWIIKVDQKSTQFLTISVEGLVIGKSNGKTVLLSTFYKVTLVY